MRKVVNIIAFFACGLLLYSLTAITGSADELIPPSSEALASGSAEPPHPHGQQQDR